MQANWDDLKVVLAIARTGSLTLAAEMLGIDQSTCSRRLGAIEAALGTILFLRTRTGVSLTEGGEIVVTRANEVERRMLRMTEDLARGTDGPVGAVRLIGESWALERLAGHPATALLARHPKLDLRLLSEESRPGSGSAPTMGLWFERSAQNAEFAIKLGEVPYAFYAAKGLVAHDLPWIATADEVAAQTSPVAMIERGRRKGERVRLAASDVRLAMTAILAGTGKGLLPMCLAEGHAGLERLASGQPELIRALHLHLHPDSVQTQRVQAVTRWLRECVGIVFGVPLLASEAI